METSLGRTVTRNTLSITLGGVALKGLGFLFSVYVVRSLGDDRFGEYSIVLAWVSLFSIFAELGISQYVTREIARDRTKTQHFFWNLVALRFALAIVGILAITFGAALVGYSPTLVLGVFFYTFSFLLAAFEAPLEAILTAYERLDHVTVLTVVARLLYFLLGGIALLQGHGFMALIAVALVTMLPQIGLAMWFVNRHRLVGFPIRIEPSQWPALVRMGVPFGIISLALSIAYSIDSVILSWFQPANVVGWYNVAYGLSMSLVFFFRGFSLAIVPSLSRAYVLDQPLVERWYHRSVKVILLTSIPISVVGMLLSDRLIHFLYGAEYEPGALVFKIIVWDLPLVMFTSFAGNITTVVGQERSAARIYTVNAVANIVLNLLTIPRYGMIAAAAVTVITDLIGAIQFHMLLRLRLNLPDISSLFVRVLLASAIMGFCIASLGNQHLFALMGVSVFLYGALAVILRVVGPEERALVLGFLRAARPFAHRS